MMITAMEQWGKDIMKAADIAALFSGHSAQVVRR
jgi:hypothetical protein